MGACVVNICVSGRYNTAAGYWQLAFLLLTYKATRLSCLADLLCFGQVMEWEKLGISWGHKHDGTKLKVKQSQVKHSDGWVILQSPSSVVSMRDHMAHLPHHCSPNEKLQNGKPLIDEAGSFHICSLLQKHALYASLAGNIGLTDWLTVFY